VTPEAIQKRRTSVSGPHLNRDLNITVVAPNGEYAAYCGIWYDPATDYAYIEPVCTDPTTADAASGAPPCWRQPGAADNWARRWPT